MHDDRNDALDLVLERVVNAPPERIWKAWTQAQLLMPWFCPKPWQTVECEIDLRPGGQFRTVMQGPDGQRFDNVGCYLEVIPNQRLAWTNALLPGFRPAPPSTQAPVDFSFTAILTLTPEDQGTRYHARVLHGSVEARQQHEAMGFHQGWNAALDQLLEQIAS